MSQDQISRIERGRLSGIPYHTVRNVFAALAARFEGVVAWRGGELDRLLDERHASLVGHAAAVYRASGWEAIPEVTFQRYGDRGSIDLLGLHPPTLTASINEMKSDILSVEETHRRHDVKVRLAASIVEERFGWRPRAIGRILVVPEATRIRRVLGRHVAVFGAAYPASSREIRGWIRQPSGPMAGIWFLSPTRPARDKRVPGGPTRARTRTTRTRPEPEKA